ncbi:hypothetical protein FS749_006761 [Ceratobasidium sp. UAMH 11750]|nr:hypothetical protein FS749_006761 [Ceratobasidium sp. UAMH 11750]
MLRHIQASIKGSLRHSSRLQCLGLRHSSGSSSAPEATVLDDEQDITDPVMEWLSSEGEVAPLDVESIVNAPIQGKWPFPAR